MAYTTTATTTYSLLKYSRSYPTGNVTVNDWQHFMNPVLRLVLDVTKTEKSELRSVRIKVIWTIQNGSVITMNDNSEIVLEDMDFLSFSNIQPRSGLPMNVPLKAVYRHTMVGIRYLHPLDMANTSIFRRFQISFASEMDTNAFINLIQGVCLCKMSPAPAASHIQNTGGLNPGTALGPSSTTVQTNNIPALLQDSQYQFGPSSQLQPPLISQGAYINNYGERTTPNTPQLSSMPPPPLPSQTLRKASSSLDLDATYNDSQNAAPGAPAQQLTQPSYMSSQTFTTPSSSQVSVRQGTMDAEKVASQAAEQKVTAHPFISALKEATSLYNLPLDVLEHSVGDVLREDGFLTLVEKLDQMWKIKSLIVKN